MARKQDDPVQDATSTPTSTEFAPSPCEFHGQGGSYVLGEDGTRRLVGRTEHRVVASFEAEQSKKGRK